MPKNLRVHLMHEDILTIQVLVQLRQNKHDDDRYYLKYIQ